MKFPRSIHILAAVLLLPLLGAAPSDGCEVSSARVTGQFSADGGFRVDSAVSADGQKLPKLAGKTLASVSASGEMALPGTDLADQQIWLIGDVDGDAGTVTVSCWTPSEEVAKACGAHPGSASCSAPAGKTQASAASCSAAKSAGCGPSASAGCGTKGASAGCGTATRSASASCGTKARSASAASNCSSSAPVKGSCTTSASAASKCCPTSKSAVKAGAGSKSAAADAYSIVFRVSGMTCNS